ncbi:hypothetical protein H488_0107420 [Kocuria sp. UCD-OTCP]|nr:hypothetical protein H488_0107420 [Kocuria sp. UCD-OTCP]
MVTDRPIPVEVVDELAEVACLCGLDRRPEERAAIHDAIFGTDAEAEPSFEPAQDPSEAVLQRRRSVAHYLSIVRERPSVVSSEADYRQALWSMVDVEGEEHRLVAGQWSALIAKDVWQEALCSVWAEFCCRGLDRTRATGRGLTWQETKDMAEAMVSGPPLLAAGERTSSLLQRLVPGGLSVTDDDGISLEVATASLEELRAWTEDECSATSGLIVLLELAQRMRKRSGAGWMMASHVESGWQPSVAAVAAGLEVHLTHNPRIGDTLWWLVSSFILPVHERIAYSKFPELTFRFRWEEGLLRFQDLGVGRFPLAAIRNAPLALLTHDLGFWSRDDTDSAVLTESGNAFLAETFQ